MRLGLKEVLIFSVGLYFCATEVRAKEMVVEHSKLACLSRNYKSPSDISARGFREEDIKDQLALLRIFRAEGLLRTEGERSISAALDREIVIQFRSSADEAISIRDAFGGIPAGCLRLNNELFDVAQPILNGSSLVEERLCKILRQKKFGAGLCYKLGGYLSAAIGKVLGLEEYDKSSIALLVFERELTRAINDTKAGNEKDLRKQIEKIQKTVHFRTFIEGLKLARAKVDECASEPSTSGACIFHSAGSRSNGSDASSSEPSTGTTSAPGNVEPAL